VDAPVERVWAALRDFHDLSWAPNVITQVDKIGDKDASEPGASRQLNGAIRETLLEIDDTDRVLRYRIDDGPPPLAAEGLTRYLGTVRAFPVTDTGRTFVLWTSEYETKNDDSVHAFCDPIYQALLKELVRHFA